MNTELITGLLIGACIGWLLSIPLVIWGDQIFAAIEDAIWWALHRLTLPK